MKDQKIVCSFCRKPSRAVRAMLTNAIYTICDECVTFYAENVIHDPGDFDVDAFRAELIDRAAHARPEAPIKAPAPKSPRILRDEPKCSFCFKPERAVRKMLHGPNAMVCDECLVVMVYTIMESQNELINAATFLSKIVEPQDTRPEAEHDVVVPP